MPRIKMPRKSTNVDMTAMCDVAFLLLTFFMLSTKFKPDEAVKVSPPSSVSADVVPDKDAFMVLFDKDGKLFFNYNNTDRAADLIDFINTSRNLGLTADEKKKFVKLTESGFGAPLSQVKSLLGKSSDELKNFKQPGIPASDSANNELRTWVAGLLNSGGGKKPENVLLKGDNGTKYPAFKEALRAFTENKIFSFKLVTMPEDAPVGTALFQERAGKK